VTAGELEAVEGVRAWIADNPASDRLLRELAAMFGLHPLRLCRLFQYRTGMTLTQFRNRLRLSLALELMADNAGSLFDIAFSLGYSSHAYFSDVFRKTFGMTPTDARALLKGHGDAAVIGAVSRIVAQSVSAVM
jgi:AraC family transcriptional regulator